MARLSNNALLAAVVTGLFTLGASFFAGRETAPAKTETVTESETNTVTETVTTPTPTPGGGDGPSGSCAESRAKAAPNGYEPNDGLDEATGPLKANRNYAAEIETENDLDYFVFCVPRRSQLEIRGRLLDCDSTDSCANVFVVLRTEEEEALGDSVSLYFRGDAGSTRYTAPEAGRYYLEVSGDETNRYDIRVISSEGVTSESP